MSMVFHVSTIGINGFSNDFSIRDDGFSMVFYRWTIGIDGFFTVEPLVSMIFQWFLTMETLVSMKYESNFELMIHLK